MSAQRFPSLFRFTSQSVGAIYAIVSAIAMEMLSETDAADDHVIVVRCKNEFLLAKLRARSWPAPIILKGLSSNE